MIDAKTEFHIRLDKLLRATGLANFQNLQHAAASLRKDAVSTIKRRKGPSRPGEPPHTHRRVFYKRAIAFDVDRQREDAVVGFRYSVIGDVGHAHEFGASRGEADYPERPTIGPALVRSAGRLGNQWKGTIGV